MLSLANQLARNTWYLVLQWMRRPWMRKIHLMPMRRMEGERRLRFYAKYKNQNRFARRIGLPLLRAAFFLLVASLLLQFTFFIAMRMSESGWLTPTSLEKNRLKDE